MREYCTIVIIFKENVYSNLDADKHWRLCIVTASTAKQFHRDQRHSISYTPVLLLRKHPGYFSTLRAL